MPSFCWPLVRGPKPAITRPLAGHRKDVAAFAARAGLSGVGVADAGVTTLALSVAGMLASFGAA
jgi:hypothetical protein